jgi:hypothetical protein
VYEVGEHAGFPYIALELVDGGTLRAAQDGRPLPPADAARLAVAVARAVHHAHEQGIVHRDLKPGNILLTAGCGDRDPAFLVPPDAVPKVTDFGLAKLLDVELDLTLTGMACGTPNYMAPEQVRGGRGVGPAADVYGLGAVLFEMLTGRPPYSGTLPNEVMDRILRDDPPSVGSVNPAVPRDLSVITARCLEKDPARRYPSAAALADDLERFLDGRPITARAVARWERAWRWCRRYPTAAALIGVLAAGFATAGGLSVALWRSNRQAEAARAEAQATSERESAARQAAEDRRLDADRKRERAEANLALARRAVSESLTRFANHPRISQDDMIDVRKLVLGAVAPLSKAILAQKADDPGVRADAGRVLFALGRLKASVGQSQGAAVDLEAAADLLRDVAGPDAPADLRLEYAGVLVTLANQKTRIGEGAADEPIHTEALAVLKAVAAANPDHWLATSELLRAYVNIGFRTVATGRTADGLADTADGLAVGQAARARFDDHPDLLGLVACLHHNHANLHRAAGHLADADRHLTVAMALHRKLAADFPDTARPKSDLAKVLLVRAEVLHATDRRPDAERAVAEAIELLERVRQKAPQAAGPTVDLAVGRLRQGMPRAEADDPAAVANPYAKAAALLDPLAKQDPKFVAARQVLDEVNRQRAKVAPGGD